METKASLSVHFSSRQGVIELVTELVEVVEMLDINLDEKMNQKVRAY